jgi:hypothetical protein
MITRWTGMVLVCLLLVLTALLADTQDGDLTETFDNPDRRAGNIHRT